MNFGAHYLHFQTGIPAPKCSGCGPANVDIQGIFQKFIRGSNSKYGFTSRREVIYQNVYERYFCVVFFNVINASLRMVYASTEK